MNAPGAVHELPDLPDIARSLTTLAATAGYTDTFLAAVPVAQRSAEGWARLMLERAQEPLRTSLPAGWRALGLRHGPPDSPDHVLGWPIRDRSDTHLLLGAGSRLGMPAELLFAHDAGGLLFATLICFENPAVRLAWRTVEAHHKRVVRTLLAGVARRSR